MGNQDFIKCVNHDVPLRREFRNYYANLCLGILIEPLPNPAGNCSSFLTHVNAVNTDGTTFLVGEFHPAYIAT